MVLIGISFFENYSVFIDVKKSFSTRSEPYLTKFRLPTFSSWFKTVFVSKTGVIREYLDPAVKVDRCAQYVNYISVAAHIASELIENLYRVFQQIQKAGVKLCIKKCQFGNHSFESLWKTISTAANASIKEWIAKLLKNLKLPSTVKTSQRCLGFVNLYRKYIPTLAQNLEPLHSLLRENVSLKLAERHKDAIFEKN